MRRAWIVILIILLAAAGWLGYRYISTQRLAAEQERQTAEAQQAEEQSENVIWASGKLVPVRWAGLSPSASGTVRAVHAGEGEWVEAGALLLETDNGVLQSQVRAAEAVLAEAEAARAKLAAGATAQEIAAARADVAAAEAGVTQAQAALEQARQAVAAAEAQLAIVQAQYGELASRPTPAEKLQAQRQIELARLALEHAQAAYDRVRGDPDIGARLEALALQQATADYDAARAHHDVLTQGATKEQLATARAQVEAARVQVSGALATVPAAEAQLLSAKAGVSRAQAALDRVQAGATAEELAMADARVASAQAAVETARAQLVQTQVLAPFAGQVGELTARPGELAVPGQTVLTLGDTREMHVETTDLRETDVVRIRESMPVEVTFDALPGRTFRGKIGKIAPMSTSEKGSTNYTVNLTVEELDPSLRWGMTAFVNIPLASGRPLRAAPTPAGG